MKDLPPLPPQMKRNPFGLDDKGKPIKEGNGKTILGPIRCVAVNLALAPELYVSNLYINCQAIQGIYAGAPRLHSGLPQAQIKELSCAVKGADYCEWEFTWQEQEKRGWFGWLRG